MPYFVDLSQSGPRRVNISTVGNGELSKQENYEMSQLGVRVAILPDSPFTKQGQIEVFKVETNENVAVFNDSSCSIDQVGGFADLDACLTAVQGLLKRTAISMAMSALNAVGEATPTFDARGLESLKVGLSVKNIDESVVLDFYGSVNGIAYVLIYRYATGNEGPAFLTIPPYPYVELRYLSQTSPAGNAAIENIFFHGF